MRWIKADKSVIICAPTSSGKTVLSSIVALIGKSKPVIGAAVNEKRPTKKMIEAKGGDDDEISGDDEDDDNEDDEDIDGEDVDGEGEGENEGEDEGGDEGEEGAEARIGKLSIGDDTPGQGADTKHATIDFANKDRIARNEFR